MAYDSSPLAQFRSSHWSTRSRMHAEQRRLVGRLRVGVGHAGGRCLHGTQERDAGPLGLAVASNPKQRRVHHGNETLEIGMPGGFVVAPDCATVPGGAGFGAPHLVHPQKTFCWRCWAAPWLSEALDLQEVPGVLPRKRFSRLRGPPVRFSGLGCLGLCGWGSSSEACWSGYIRLRRCLM
jgi:hypothetical protein